MQSHLWVCFATQWCWSDTNKQSCYPRGLALASRILEDTLWRSWPWPWMTWSWPWPWPWHLRSWPWPWEKSLGLGLAKANTFPPRPRPRGCNCSLRVCSPHTHGVTWHSVISYLGMLQRLACELDVGCKIVRVCEVRAAIWCQCV